MQTKIVAKHIRMKYRCPKCNFKLTIQGGAFDSVDFIDKIQQKAIKRNSDTCTICKKGVFDLTSIICEVDTIVNRNYYEIKWRCEECGVQWHSIENLNPKDSEFDVKLDRIIRTTICINEDCGSGEVKTVTLMYCRKT